MNLHNKYKKGLSPLFLSFDSYQPKTNLILIIVMARFSVAITLLLTFCGVLAYGFPTEVKAAAAENGGVQDVEKALEEGVKELPNYNKLTQEQKETFVKALKAQVVPMIN